MVRISEKDLTIIRILEQDARTPYTKIARELGVTEAAVRKRVRKLERAGIIRGYRAVIDPKKLGYNVVAQIGFDVDPEHYVDVLSRVRAFPEVRRMFSTTGDHMVMIECWFRNSNELVAFVRRLEGLEGVSRVCPAIIVEEIK